MRCLSWLIRCVLRPKGMHVATPCTPWCIIGVGKPDEVAWALLAFTVDLLQFQEVNGVLGSFETPRSSALVKQEPWIEAFGSLQAPRAPWAYVEFDACMFGMRSPGVDDQGRPMKKGHLWMANFSLAPAALRCREGVVSPLSRSSQQIASVNLESAVEADSSGDEELVEPFVPVKVAASPLAADRGRREDPVQLFYLRAGGITEDGLPAEGDDQPQGRPFAAESEQERRARAERLEAEAAAAGCQWAERARARQWDAVHAPADVYRFHGLDPGQPDPRRTDEYRATVLKVLGFDDPEKRPHLSPADRAAAAEVMARKAAALWVKDSPRTTVRGVLHDVVAIGAPCRSAPMRLKGEALQFVEEEIRKDVLRGQLERGNSAWGSWAFPTRASPRRKRRIVVDYRRVNQRTVRAIYFLRRADDIKQEAAGSVFFSLLDAVSGFNQIRNSERARRILAVLANSGCYLANMLTMGPTNGPEDFSFVVDLYFSLGKRSRRRLMREWLPYIDDFCVRTGRWRAGAPMHDEELADAMSRVAPVAAEPRTLEESLREVGVVGGNLTAALWLESLELRKFDPRWPSPYAHAALAWQVQYAAASASVAIAWRWARGLEYVTVAAYEQASEVAGRAILAVDDARVAPVHRRLLRSHRSLARWGPHARRGVGRRDVPRRSCRRRAPHAGGVPARGRSGRWKPHRRAVAGVPGAPEVRPEVAVAVRARGTRVAGAVRRRVRVGRDCVAVGSRPRVRHRGGLRAG